MIWVIVQLSSAIIVSKDWQVNYKSFGKMELSGKRYVVLFEIQIEHLIESITPIGVTIANIKENLNSQINKYEQSLPNPVQMIPNLHGTLVNNTQWEKRDESRSYKSLTPILNSQMR